MKPAVREQVHCALSIEQWLVFPVPAVRLLRPAIPGLERSLVRLARAGREPSDWLALLARDCPLRFAYLQK